MTKLIPSKVWLPKNAPYHNFLDFFCDKFPQIHREAWIKRFAEKKITDTQETAIHASDIYCGDQHLIYYREVENEAPIPVKEHILFEDENLILVDKPHFLPIHPAGPYVKETLVYRLRQSQNNPDIAPLHRIDRLTAGLVLLSKKVSVRKDYQLLFENRAVDKTYLAISKGRTPSQTSWHLKNHIGIGDPWFLSAIKNDAAPNSESHIKFLKEQDGFLKFKLKPISGKKHQLRVHLASIGFPILYDPLYPSFVEKPADNYAKPLQLLAQSISFIDPYSKKKLHFESQLKLRF